MKLIRRHALYLAWLVALVSLLFSLYWSEVRHFELCNLCWYQRGFILTLVVILGIAAYRQDFGIILYGKTVAVIGALFAFYHILLQKLPALQRLNICGAGPDCSQDILNYWGFVTTPMLSLVAFLAILFFLCTGQKKSRSGP